MASFMDVGALSALLQKSAESTESTGGGGGGGAGGGGVKAVTPADFGPRATPAPAPSKTKGPRDSKDIWDADEVPTREEVLDDAPDGRERPKYEILHMQHVSTEDVYLGMSEKDPSSSSCDHMVVKINLPGTKFSDVDLDVQRQTLVAQTPRFKLAIYLPRAVRHEEGSAKWDGDRHILTVRLPVIKSDIFDE